MNKQSAKSKTEHKIDKDKAAAIIEKAISNGFHKASTLELLSKARSLKHLRSLIGSYQRGELDNEGRQQ